jgi:hypothetical protein
MGKDLNLRLIIRGSQDHALVGPQPKGNIIKGLCCQKRRPFLFGVITVEFKVLKEAVSSKNGEGSFPTLIYSKLHIEKLYIFTL